MVGNNFYSKDKLPGARIISCPKCKAENRNVTYGQASYFACPACHKLIDLNQENYEVIFNFTSKYVRKPLIPLGSRGIFNETEYEVIAFLVGKEVGFRFTWSEYVLFNPIYGYAYLSEYEGHWNFIEGTNDYPRNHLTSNSFVNKLGEFEIFHKYKSEIIYAQGELNWNIKDKEKPTINEFISPPYMMTREVTSKSLTWYLGKYMEPVEISKAFNISILYPQRTGIGANQPYKEGLRKDALKKITYFAFIILLIIQLLFIGASKQEVVFSNTFFLPQGDARPIVTAPFQLKNSYLGTANLEFNLFSKVDNDWFEVGLTLINDKTGEEFQFEQGVEYYYGYDGGEHWSEGSTNSSKLLTYIPDGIYHLNIQPIKNDISKELHFNLDVVRDIPVWSNFFFVVIFLLAYPVFAYFKTESFERGRWMNSNYSPYGN